MFMRNDSVLLVDVQGLINTSAFLCSLILQSSLSNIISPKMRITIILSYLSVAIAALDAKRCGTKAPSKEVKALHAAYAKQDDFDRQRGGPIQQASYVINTYIHIITDSRWIVPETAITNQVSARGW